MIILFTDFGWHGPYVGQLKTVLACQAPSSPVIDLMHDAPAFNPRASAYLLAAMLPYTPKNSIIVGVVDPGVGNPNRQPVIIECDGRWLVGPNNGLFSLIVQNAQQTAAREIVWRPEDLSSSFHGRDLFAPVAAMLARGDLPEVNNLPVSELVGMDWSAQIAEIIYFDEYGNAMTGLSARHFADDVVLQLDGQAIRYAATFSAVRAGQPFWYRNSNGLLEIAVNQGSAKNILQLGVGTQITVAS